MRATSTAGAETHRIGIATLAFFFTFAASLLAVEQASGQQQRSASSQAMLEEVIVTARRREEGLQDLPLSIAAITADQMQVQGVYNTEDAGEFIPNLTMTQPDRANETRVIIRGIGGGHGDPVQVFGTGMYIDGHYIPSSLGGFMSTLDIARMEVLRGPQGTLFGKNTTGGAVNIITEKPGPEFESSLTLRAGEWGQRDVRGVVNVPLGENVYARLSAASEQLDGYYYNRNLDSWVDHKDLNAFTGTLRITPGDQWTIDTTVNFARQRDGNVGAQCQHHPDAPAWGSFAGIGNVERIYAGATADFHEECQASVAMGPFVQSSEKIQFSNVDQEGIFLSAQWDPGTLGGLDGASLRLTNSHRYITYKWLRDADRTSFPIDTFAAIGPRGQYNRTHNFEAVFEAEASERLQFTVGANWFQEDGYNGPDSCFRIFTYGMNGLGPFDPDNPDADIPCPDVEGFFFEFLPLPRENTGGISPFLGNVRVTNESTGLFGHLTYALNESWDFDFGVRYTNDDRYFNNMEFTVQDCFWTDNPTGACSPTLIMNQETVLEGGFTNEVSDEWSEVTPMFSFTRNLQPGSILDSGMYYILYSEGFLTGGFNPEVNLRQVPELTPLLTYEPEHVSNYEFGFKGTFAGGNLRLSSAVFYMDYTDKQDSVTLDNSDGRFGPDATVGVVTNASTVEIYGLELELNASPWDGGFIQFNTGYLQNKYDEYISIDPTTLSETDLSDARISDLSPEWSANGMIQHAFQLANGATLTPMLGFYYQTGYEYLGGLTRDAPESYCYQDAYSKWRTRLSYEPAAGNYSVALFGSNITDELILESCSNGRAGTFHYRFERPETWGIEFSTRFGST